MGTALSLTTSEQKRYKELTGIIRKGIHSFVEVGRALLEVRADSLYRMEYPTFEAYVQSAIAIEVRYARRLCDASVVVEQLADGARGPQKYPMLPSGERQCREMVKLGERANGQLTFDNKLQTCWKRVLATAQAKAVPVTAGLVKATVLPMIGTPGDEESRDWTKRQEQKHAQVEKGKTVVINMHKDLALLDWATDNGLYVRADRWTDWGNPFRMDEQDHPYDGSRDEVCDNYEGHYWPCKPSLEARIQKELGPIADAEGHKFGRVLGCHCAPARCHADFLARVANGG